MIRLFQSHRLAFVLAGLVAVRMMLPGLSDLSTHPGDILFCYFPIQFLGVLSSALPRWIERPIVPSWGPAVLVTGHAVAFAVGLADPAIEIHLHAGLALTAGLLFFANAVAARSTRSLDPLAFVLAQGAVAVASQFVSDERLTRAGLALIVLFCLEMERRVAPAFWPVAREKLGRPPRPGLPASLTLAQRLAALFALATFVFDRNAAVLALAAALLGYLWVLLPRPWQVWRIHSLMALTIGMLGLRTGFLLLALHDAGIAAIDLQAIVHSWAVGGLALMAIVIATSFVRRAERLVFLDEVLSDAAFLLMALAAVARVAAAEWSEGYDSLILVARFCWSAAFASAVGFIVRHSLRPLGAAPAPGPASPTAET
ncbi:MAG: NnrS family protein [Ancalomicrobiaceae bacterium]|nr:NnrS family protein [Ancalomicrobiaceae bacterium]